MTTIATVTAFLANPLVWAALSALGTVLGLVGAAYIKSQPKAKDIAQDIDDACEEIEPLVIWAENTFVSGDHRYSRVLDKMEAWMLAQGITGQRGRLLKKYLPALIEAAVKKVDPKLGPNKAA